MSVEEKLTRLEEMKRKSEVGGGEERLKSQHAKGKLSARERLDLLMDEGSFVEMDRFVTHRSTEFNLANNKILGDGVVTGYGTVNGRWSTSSHRISQCSAARFRRLTPKRS